MKYKLMLLFISASFLVGMISKYTVAKEKSILTISDTNYLTTTEKNAYAKPFLEIYEVLYELENNQNKLQDKVRNAKEIRVALGYYELNEKKETRSEVIELLAKLVTETQKYTKQPITLILEDKLLEFDTLRQFANKNKVKLIGITECQKEST